MHALTPWKSIVLASSILEIIDYQSFYSYKTDVVSEQFNNKILTVYANKFAGKEGLELDQKGGVERIASQFGGPKATKSRGIASEYT